MSMDGNTSKDSWCKTADRFSIPRSAISEAKSVLQAGKANTSVISGEDMLQYPIDNGWKSDHYDIVLVDECQDLNPQQISFLACIPTNRIVFVGDKNQAIYGFRGSDPKAISKIIDDYAPEEFEMNESFRCPTEIIRKINKIVPNMMSLKVGGQVSRTTYKNVTFDDSCFILCRVNSHLIKLAYTFLKNGQHFSIGTTFIKQLEKDLKPFLTYVKDLAELKKSLRNSYSSELSQAINKNWDRTAIENKFDALLALAENASSFSEVTNFTKKLKVHTNGASERRLMSIHAAKGLEAEHVYFLESGIIKYFKSVTQEEWRKQEENNLYYVACTRALSKLTFVD